MRALLSDRQHLGVDVADRGMKAVPGCLGRAEGDIAGPAGDVEQREGRVTTRGLSAVIIASFQSRCIPPDIRSFIKS